MWEWLKSIAGSTMRSAWLLLPVATALIFFRWVFEKWIPARGEQVVNAVFQKVGLNSIDFASVGLDWARINQWIPIPEAIALAVKFVGIWALIVMCKWVKKAIPFGT